MSRRTYNPESPSFSETIRNLIFDENGELIEESETEDDPSPRERQPGPSTRGEHTAEVRNPELLFEEDFDVESDGEIPDFDDNSEDDPDYEPDSETDSDRDSTSGDDEELLNMPRSFINIERLENPDVPLEVPPTFLGKNDFEWHSEPPNNRVRTSASNIIRGLPGVRGPAMNLGPSPSALEVWKILIDHEIVSEIVTWTNKKLTDLRQKIQEKAGVRGDLKARYLRRYGNTNSTEINALCGVLLLTSILKGDNEDVGSLFASGSTGRPIFRAVFSGKRFEILMAALRFDNPDDRIIRKQENQAAAILNVFNSFVANCKKPFAIGEFACIDEMLIPFRGRCRFRVYMPNKPAKYGVKLLVLTDARNAYFYDAYIYSGKGSDGYGLTPEENNLKVPTQALIHLVNCIKNSGKNITADNYFCSVESCKELKKRGLTLVGTMNKKQRELPPEFLPQRSRQVSSSLFGFNNDMNLVSFVPKKNRSVTLISSMHHTAEIDESTRKPEIIMFYNSTKGGVDLLDQKCSKFSMGRKTLRWPLAVFFRILEIASANSHLLYTCFRGNPVLKRFDFVKKMALELMTPHIRARLTIPTLNQKLRTEMEEVLGINTERRVPPAKPDDLPAPPRPRNERKTCKTCDPKLKRRTSYFCKGCQIPICLQCSHNVCRSCISEINN